MQTARRNMTIGSPTKLILQFLIPLLLGMLFQQCYNLVDTMIVGRFLGPQALAAVGGTGSINFMIIGFCMGVCNGFAVPVAKAFGAQDEQALRAYVTNGVKLSIGFAAVMTLIVCVFCRAILVGMQTPPDILEDAYGYIFVIFLGIPVVYFYHFIASVLRSLGDSKTPVYFLVVASVLNIAFDLIAILGLNLGVAGAAWATVLAQAISGVLCLIYVMKKQGLLKLEKEDWKSDYRLMKELCWNGVPMGLQYSITAIGGVIVQTAVNGLGFLAVASITAASKVSMFLTCAFDAMGATMATYASQNIGAGKPDRVTQGLKSCAAMAFVYSLVMYGIVLLWGEQMIMLFVDASETVIIQNALQCLNITGLFFFAVAMVTTTRYTIQGVGFAKLAIIAGVFEMVARTVVGFVFIPLYGYNAACFSNPAAWVMADVFLIPAYIYVIRKVKRDFEPRESHEVNIELEI